MRVFRIDLSYDGTDFQGWQVQPEADTIQGRLEAALQQLTGAYCPIMGAGRTDSGVHAMGQVASFESSTHLDSPTLHKALNALLPSEIRVIGANEVPDDFHARRSAREKIYEYRIVTGEILLPFEHRYVFHNRSPLSELAMTEAASHLTGRHDFSSFRASGCSARTSVRDLRRLDVIKEGPRIRIIAVGDGFLRHMVRILAGTLIQVGRGRMESFRVAEILESRDRRRAGPTAPPRGLYLMKVIY